MCISCITKKIANRMTMIRMKTNPTSANSKISTTNNLGSLSKSRTNSKLIQTKNQFLTAYHNACQELILIYTGPPQEIGILPFPRAYYDAILWVCTRKVSFLVHIRLSYCSNSSLLYLVRFYCMLAAIQMNPKQYPHKLTNELIK